MIQTVFKRKLYPEEIKIVERIVDFVKDKHHRSEGHDYSHVLEVCRLSIEIAHKVKDPVDPFILMCGALLHDIGRINAPNGLFHGVDGAARANELLKNYINDEKTSMAIQNVIVRHTPESMISPQTPEEKVVFDADTIERLGFMGMVRGLMGKSGTMEEIIEDRVHKRLHDYNKLYYPVSKKMSKKAYKETIAVSKTLKKDLVKRTKEINEISTYKLIKGQ
ncbi:HD domain-containing protein [Candidatus Woesearchaeota archaeon]|nr:HD domain-containing protein [Candidatus Woesearchaeota archaeon]